RAPAEERASFDDNLGAKLRDELLVDPEVEGTLGHAHAEPAGVLPCARRVVVVEAVEPPDGRADSPTLDDIGSSASQPSRKGAPPHHDDPTRRLRRGSRRTRRGVVPTCGSAHPSRSWPQIGYGRCRARTCDPLLVRQVLSQL